MATQASELGDSLNQRHRVGEENTMVMMFVGGSCVDRQQNSCTVPTVGNLRGGSFLFPPEPLWVKLLSTTSSQISFEFLFIKTCPPNKLHNRCGFVIKFRDGIRYLSCQGASFDKKEFKRNLAGSGYY
jgi:hypothetical protein